MSKIEKAKNPKEQTENTELMVKAKGALATAGGIESFLPMNPEDMDDGMVETSSGGYFPHMEMVFPIMQTPDNRFYNNNQYKFGFVNGQTFEAFPAGTIFTCVDMRNAIKRTYVNVEGKTKSEYAYDSITRGGKLLAGSKARYDELLSEAQDRSNRDVNLGASIVVVAIYPDGKTVCMDFSAFKTVHGYMYPVLKPAKLQSGLGLRIDIEDHTDNLTKSKSSGHYYPDGKKFKEWEHVELSKEQGKMVMNVVKSKLEEYENWLKK